MKLEQLLKGLDVIDVVGSRDVEVADIAYHTKDVKPGSMFIAISGSHVDGHNYIDAAIGHGASVIVTSRRVELPEGIANVVVSSTRAALAVMSSHFFGEPSKDLKLIGVTGTNGKTTITYLLEEIWKRAACPMGVVGTVNYRYGNIATNPKHTTPESYELQKLFRDMVSAGVKCVAMEVSSHSLDQNRVYGCHFNGAIFTNLTQDHLDYHLDMNRYKKAKEKLFTEHLCSSEKKNKWAAVNIDDPFGVEIAKGLSCRVLTFSVNKEADIFAEEIQYSLKGLNIKMNIGGKSFRIKSRLIGKHNASNIMGAIAAAFAMGQPTDVICQGVESLERVPGRLEPVENFRGLNVLIDYAHTPDALRNVTTALKELKPKKLITVFGCGGDRDKTKRPLMGFETALRSDVVIVTSDNPRSEDPNKIIEEIVSGVRRVGLEEGRAEGGYFIEVNRRRAIEMAINLAAPKDVVLIAGKGHEDYQIIGSERLVFDDYKVAQEVINKI